MKSSIMCKTSGSGVLYCWSFPRQNKEAWESYHSSQHSRVRDVRKSALLRVGTGGSLELYARIMAGSQQVIGKYCLLTEWIYKIRNWYIFRAFSSALFSTFFGCLCIFFSFHITHNMGLLATHLSFHPFEPTSPLVIPLPHPPQPCMFSLSVTSPRSLDGNVGSCDSTDELNGWSWEEPRLLVPSLISIWKISVSITFLGFDQNKKYQTFIAWINLWGFFYSAPSKHSSIIANQFFLSPLTWFLFYWNIIDI